MRSFITKKSNGTIKDNKHGRISFKNRRKKVVMLKRLSFRLAYES
jgi:hypothetical protein